MSLDDALIAEALRVYRRYALEIVEGLGLCPWAEHARKSGRVVERVLLCERAELSPVLGLIDEYTESEIEILLAIFPRLNASRKAFEQFVARVRDAEAERQPLGAIPFALAAFHPDATPELDDPERLIPFLRRTPDLTIQFVRRSVLERVRQRSPEGTEFVDIRFLDPRALDLAAEPSLRERIATQNLSSVQREGVERVEALLRDIKRDRDESYARLAARSASATVLG